MATETILIVDDRRENIVHLANNVLKPHGYEIITAMDGQIGLKRTLADRPDLVIMDLNMPKMDGLEVLAALREQEVDIPVILTTFYGSEQVAEQALRLGAVDYVVKPYEVDEMLSAVRKALASRASRPAETPVEPEESMPLTRHVERWMRDMNILTRVGKALVAQLDTQRVCSRTVEAAIYISRADHAFLFLAREDNENLCLCATRGPKDRRVRMIQESVASELVRQVAGSGKMLLKSRTLGEDALVEIAGELLGPSLAVPLRWQREVIGVLLVTRSPGEAGFHEGDTEWLTGLADYAAIAIRNARAYEEREPPPLAAAPAEEESPAWQDELAQLAASLHSALETVQRLAARASGEDGAGGGADEPARAER